MECRTDVQWGRLQQLVRRTVRGSHIHQERPEQLITHALKPVELMNIKQVPWVLPVKRRNQLPGVKIRESNHLHLSEAELFLRPGNQSQQLRLMHGSPHDR